MSFYLICLLLYIQHYALSEENEQREKLVSTLKWIFQNENSTNNGKNIKTKIQNEGLNVSHSGIVQIENSIGKRKSLEKFGGRLRRSIWRGEDSSLHRAITNHELNKIKVLLEMKYDVNLGGYEGKTPLGLAAEKGYETIVKFLLEKNAMVDKKDFFEDAPIHYAAYNGKSEVVKILVDHGADVNSKGKFGERPLHIAARKGYVTIVKLLLSRSASVDLKTDLDSGIRSDPKYVGASIDYHSIDNSNFGETPLHMAARNGHETIVNLLLFTNASVDLKNQIGMTPLYIAVVQKKLNITKTLIAHGASVNVQGNTGMTPLMVAAMNGDEGIVNLLISKNATLETKDYSNNGAIHYAALNGSLLVVMALLDHGADGNSKGTNGKTPLSFALRTRKEVTRIYLVEKESTDSKKEHKEMNWVNSILEEEILTVMRCLIRYGAEVNSQDFLDQTVLHEAAAMGYPGVVGYLASEGASFNVEDYVCFTPLQWAVYNGNVDVIKTLLIYGDDVNRRGCNNITALHLAITANNTDMIKFLLSKDADVNVMSEDGWTPLDVAFQSSSEEYLKFLLNNRAKLEDGSFLGSKVLFDVVTKKSLDDLYLLLDSVENMHSYPSAILNYAIRNNFYDGVDLLITFGANIPITKKDIHGNLPLSSAVMSKNVNMVKLILDTVAKKNVKEDFQTFLDAYTDAKFFFSSSLDNDEKIVEYRKFAALHIASKLGLTEIARLLISHSASLNIRDEWGYTPLHYACEEGHVEVVKLLLDSRADKDSLSLNGTTPLQIACNLRLYAIVKLLLSDPPALINLANNTGYTPLHFASMNGYDEIIAYLLVNGANKELRTDDLKTPLHLASLKGHKVAVDILLIKGTNIDVSDIDGMTPLHLAVKEGHAKIVIYLLKSGAFVNSRNKNGSTPLHLVSGSKIKLPKDFKNVIISSLITHGANVNSLDFKHMTPLHVSAKENSLDSLKFLLSYKADLFRRDTSLNQPIHYAALNGNYDVVLDILKVQKGITLIMSVNSDQETPLFLAAREGYADVVALILRAGVEGLQPDFHGRTALHRAAGRGHIEVVKILRRALLNKDKVDKWGFTALNYGASWKGHQEVIRYLSTTQLDITLSYYLNISNPLQRNRLLPKLMNVPTFPGMKVAAHYFMLCTASKRTSPICNI